MDFHPVLTDLIDYLQVGSKPGQRLLRETKCILDPNRAIVFDQPSQLLLVQISPKVFRNVCLVMTRSRNLGRTGLPFPKRSVPAHSPRHKNHQGFSQRLRIDILVLELFQCTSRRPYSPPAFFSNARHDVSSLPLRQKYRAKEFAEVLPSQ